jgi:hypothetical protein
VFGARHCCPNEHLRTSHTQHVANRLVGAGGERGPKGNPKTKLQTRAIHKSSMSGRPDHQAGEYDRKHGLQIWLLCARGKLHELIGHIVGARWPSSTARGETRW